VEDYLQTHHYQFTTVNDPQGKIADQWQECDTDDYYFKQRKNGFGHNRLDELLGLKSAVVFHRVFWLSGTKSITIHRLILKRTEL